MERSEIQKIHDFLALKICYFEPHQSEKIIERFKKKITKEKISPILLSQRVFCFLDFRQYLAAARRMNV